MVLKTRAKKEGWPELRTQAEHKACTRATQKTAEAAADNAVLAADIKKNLLTRLQRIEAKYPIDATEVRTKQGNNIAIFRLRDLTAAFKDLTDGMQMIGDAPKVDNSLIEALEKSIDGLGYIGDIPEGVGNEVDEA